MNTFFIQYKKYIQFILLFCIFFVFTFFLYYKTLFLGFFSDDYHFLHIMSQSDMVWKFFLKNNIGDISGGSYGPLLDILWNIQYKIFAMNAWYYHIVVLSVYSMTAWFIYLFTFRLSEKNILSFLSAILFLVLQNHTSSLAWVAIMPHIWATLFFIIGLYSYYIYVTKHISYYYVISFICMISSLFIKEITIMFPFVLFLIDILFSSLSLSQHIWYRLFFAIKRVSIFILGTILYLIIRYSIVGYVVGYYAESHISFRIIPKIKMFIEILLSMGVTSPHRQILAQFLMTYWGILISSISILMILFLIIEKSYRKILGFLIASYIIMSLPFVNLMFDSTSNSGERYGYLLSVFFVMILNIWIYALWRRVSWGYIGFLIMMCLIISGSLVQMLFKLDTWYISADIRDTIISDIASFDFYPDDYVIFIGIPDNIRGVEIVRNAIREMIDLETDKGFILGDRIPLYIELNLKKNNFTYIDFIKDIDNDKTYHIQSIPFEHSIFTGLPMFEHQSGIYTMKNFRHRDHSGDALYIDIDEDFMDEYIGRIVYVYFDGKHMKSVIVKEK